MKKLHQSFLIAATGIAALCFTACDNDKFLSVEHYDILPADQMFKTQNDALSGLNGIYDCLFADNTYADGWNYKPQLFFGCHPTLDTQATGWDVQWGQQSWTADDSDLGRGYNYSYRAIGRANDFLGGLEDEHNTEVKKFPAYNTMDGEAHALRAYFYMFLAQNWGRVPMLATGESFLNTPNKAAAETDDEMWDFIIDDLKTAVRQLDWKPYNGEYGRCTKGMALSYLGEAYLWKAYKARLNSKDEAKSTENVKLAKEALEQVVNSGTYDLAPSFSTLWDVGEAWPKEAVWQVVNDMGAGNYGKWDSDAHIFNNFFAGSTNGGGGWGSEYLSWELYFAYENGDKRRDASMCTSPVAELPEAQRSRYTYGRNPFTQEMLGVDEERSKKEGRVVLSDNNGYMFNNGGDFAPAIWTLKLWRSQRCQWSNPHSPCHFYYKRYAGVLLDYAECLFRLNGDDDATAWSIIDRIRNRAFGNLEVGKADALNKQFVAYYNSLVGQGGYGNDPNKPWNDYKALKEYPIPFNTKTVEVPDAKTYYTRYASESNDIHRSFTAHKCKVWEVALGQERRKEFSSEWNLKADLQRSDFLIPSIECNYPKGVGLPNTDSGKKGNWHYYRTWDFDTQRLIMPIPTDELLRNKLIKQNPGY